MEGCDLQVIVNGLVWLPTAEFSYQQLLNIKNRLTIYPKKTTDLGNKPDPPPIFLYRHDERNAMIGVPRNFYSTHMSRRHDEILKVSKGNLMQEGLKTIYKSDGHYAEQALALDAFDRKRTEQDWGGFMLNAGCGFGKALRDNEPVVTPDGFKPISDIKVGDKVAGTNGEFCNVLGVYPQGLRDIYRLYFTDGTAVDCDIEHLWTFVLRRVKGQPVKTLTVKELLNESLRTKAGRQFWLPDRQPVVWNRKVDLPIDAYTLGVLLGDGCLSGNDIYLTVGEKAIAEGMILPDGIYLRNAYKNSGKAFDYRLSRKQGDYDSVTFKSILSKLGLAGLKSKSKFVPEIYKFASVSDRVALLQGLFDTDGYAISSGLVEYTTASSELADDVSFVVQSLGGTANIKYRRVRYKKKDGEYSGLFDSFRMTIKLPVEFVPFRFSEHKLNTYKSAVHQRKLGIALDFIENLRERDNATCIEVDSPDHLFLTSNFLPTHNTAVALEMARRVGRATLVLVHQEFFIDQWRSRIKMFMPDARVGIIRQNKCEYKDVDFSIGMLQSLAKDDGSKYPKEIYDAFGVLINDEVHRVGSQTWSSIIPKFSAAWRIGLSATPTRKDGAQNVFFYHISNIDYKAETEAQIPGLRTLKVHSKLKPIARGRYRVAVRDLNSAQILTQLGEDQFRSRAIVDQLITAVKAGRKVMVVSERMVHLKSMSDMLTNSLFAIDLPFSVRIDYYTGEWYSSEIWEKTNKRHKKGDIKMKKRTREELALAESANVIFSTKQMVSEGLDIQALDVLVLATPMGDIEQVVGRVRRWCEPENKKCSRLCAWRAGRCKGKPEPIVMDVVDVDIPQVMGKWKRRQGFYSGQGIK